MRTKTLEIRWHDTQPIFSSDSQPYPPHQLKRLLSQQQSGIVSSGVGKEKEKEVSAAGRSYRVATGGADNHVRLWLIHPNIPDVLPTNAAAAAAGPSSAQGPAPSPPPPRAEFLATLRRHTAAVNVVRWSPKEDVLASAGDDGFLLLWVPKSAPDGVAGPSSGAFADSSATEEGQKEFWRVKTFIRATTNEIYDLAWSPDGAHLIVGCTDNVARIYDAATGACIKAIAEHTHYVQGVAWDPLNEFVATQSSDRSVHIHRIHQSKGEIDFIPHGRSERLTFHGGGSRHPSFDASCARPNMARQDSTALSDAGSVFDSAASDHGVDDSAASVSTGVPAGPLTPSASMPGTPAMPSTASMKPPSSRRSSMSSSVAASPPPPSSRFARSPSPLPAIRPNSQPPTAPTRPAVTNKLYGDESYTHYFRRLTFSPDGALLLTPAGQIESSLLAPSLIAAVGADTEGASSSKECKPKRPAAATDATKPTVYIYSRANLSNGPIAHLPGQRTASVAVRFNPILYDLRDGMTAVRSPKTIVVDEKSADEVKVRMYDAVEAAVVKDDPPANAEASSSSAPLLSGAPPVTNPHLLSPSPSPAPPALSASSTFALPYRMYFAVATQDAVLLYDTQQTSPIAIFVGLHYAGFTDLTWSPDGQTLLLSSIDGYCTVVVFDPSELGTLHHTQQHQKQLQALAQNLSAASHGSTSLPPSPAPAHGTPISLATPTVSSTDAPAALASSGGHKRSISIETPVIEETLVMTAPPSSTPAATPTSSAPVAAAATPPLGSSPTAAASLAPNVPADGNVKKKRRVELKHLGPLD